jgi:hypothetical protein
MAQQSSSSGGIGVLGMLGVVFVGLKLGGIISWSWWLVTLPFWGGFALAIAVIGLAVIVKAAAIAIEGLVYRNRGDELRRIRARRQAVESCNELANRLGGGR